MPFATTLEIGLALLVGAFLGWVQFRGLWETVLRLPTRSHPTVWLAASLVARLAIVLAGFIVLARLGGLPALLAGFAALLTVRAVLIRRLRPQSPSARDSQ